MSARNFTGFWVVERAAAETAALRHPQKRFGQHALATTTNCEFILNRIAGPGSADVSAAGWNCLSQRSEPAGRQRSQEVEE
jgi:hypothetical protein